MLIESGLPSSFWGEALTFAIYLRNRGNPKGELKSRYEIFFKRKPNVIKLRKFGTQVYFTINSPKKKLNDKARLGVFVGVNEEGGDYRKYDTERRCIC